MKLNQRGNGDKVVVDYNELTRVTEALGAIPVTQSHLKTVEIMIRHACENICNHCRNIINHRRSLMFDVKNAPCQVMTVLQQILITYFPGICVIKVGNTENSTFKLLVNKCSGLNNMWGHCMQILWYLFRPRSGV